MIRLAFATAVIAVGTTAMAQSVIDPVVVADKACAAFNNPSMPQTVKDGMRKRIYGPLARPLPAGATEDFKAMWAGYALVRERGCGKP